MVEATLKISTFLRSSRVSDLVRRRCCIEHDLAKGSSSQANAGTEEKWKSFGINGRSSAPPRRTVKEWR